MRILLLVLLALGCGRAVSPDAGDPSASFPHAADFADTHGALALADGATCGSCHALGDGDPVKGATPAAPACQSCHAYPHQGGLVSGGVHGPAWRADPSACSGCHGEAGDTAPGGVAAGQCVSCHHSYPHPAGFEAPEGHGAALLARGGGQSCQACHGTQGEAQTPACATCHAAYPHPEDWTAGHGAAARADLASCTQRCHGAGASDAASDAASDGLNRVSCASCHDLFPHPDGWAQDHAATAQRRGSAACETCHADGDARGPDLPVSCAASCHGGGAE